jgi:AcrR family transcriptional regulator
VVGESRQALLSRVVDHLTQTGSADISLRQLAAAVGTSHRMLLYHFGSADALLSAVVLEVEQRMRTWFFAVAGTEDLSLRDLSYAMWKRVSAVELEGVVQLFFSLYTRLLEQQRRAEVADLLVTSWLEPAAAFLVGRGVPAGRAGQLARLGTAATRGLLLDVLATGDRKAADAAARAYADAMFG